MAVLSDLKLDELETTLAQGGCRPSHARRLLRHFYDNCGNINWEQLRAGRAVEKLFDGPVKTRQSRIIARTTACDGTVKLLIGFDDGGAVESVLMPAYRADRAAGCVSSQIGCAMGCDFCASTRGGLERSLSAGEIVEQFLHLKAEARSLGRRLSTLVFMGMGEPLLNLPAVIRAIELIGNPTTGALGGRQITVSTVGIVPGIDALAEADLNVHLALSLHAPDDATRAMIVPMNRRYPVREIMDAADRFEQRTRRIPTIEYCMLAGVNDSDEQARLLVELIGPMRAHVNLIPYNAIGPGLSGRTYERPTKERVDRFLHLLWDGRIVAHRRDTRGDDVNAACGQLRERMAVHSEPSPLYSGERAG